MLIIKNDNKLARVNLLAATMFSNYIINLLIGGILGFNEDVGLMVFNAIFGVLFIYAWKDIVRNNVIYTYIIYAIFFMLYIWSFMLNSIYIEYYIKLGIIMFFIAMPWIFVGNSIRDFGNLHEHLKKIAYAILVLFLINYLFFGQMFAEEGFSYSQGHSYALLPAAVIFLGALIEQFSWRNLMLAVVSVLLMFYMGARGPIMCYILYLLIKLSIGVIRSKKAKHYVYVLIFLLILILGIVFLDSILEFLIQISTNLGVSTRLIHALYENTFFGDKARTYLYTYGSELIGDNPWLGVGLGGDRLHISRNVSDTSEAFGLYPHNFFMEILIQYGVIIGAGILVAIVSRIFICLVKYKNKEFINVLSIYIAVAFLPLLFSGSYLIAASFWGFIGILLIPSRYIDKT